MLLTQAAWFHRQGHPVRAVFLYDKQGLTPQWAQQHPFEIINLDAWQSGRPWFLNIYRFLRGLLRLMRLVKGVQVVETFTQHSNLIGLPLAWLRRVPLRLASLHGAVANPLGMLSFFHGRLVNSQIVSGLVVVSQEVEQLALAEGVHPEKIYLIENGIELSSPEQFSAARRAALRQQVGVPENELLLMAVGRLAAVKGHADLLRALAALPEPRPRLALVGDGELRVGLEALATQLGLAGQVTFLGNQLEARRWLPAADVYVQPSLSEGLSIALLEAMAAGLPVVATRVGAATQIIADGEHGLLVPPADPQALAAALQRALADHGLRTHLGRAAQARVRKHYDAEQMCNNYASLMAKLLNEAR